MWEKEKSYSLLVRVQADGVTMEISIGVLQKAINEIIIKPYSIPGHICKGLYIPVSRYFLSHILCCSIHNS